MPIENMGRQIFFSASATCVAANSKLLAKAIRLILFVGSNVAGININVHRKHVQLAGAAVNCYISLIFIDALP